MDTKDSKTVTMLFDENRRLRQALEASMSGVLVTNSDGIIRFVNKQWLKMHNVTITQVLNKSIFELHPERSSEIKNQMKRATTEGIQIEATEHELDHHKKIYLGGFLKKLIGRQQDTSGYLWSMHDITEQMKAQESLRRQNRTLKKLNELMVGRELQMVNLKKEIKKLKEELGAKKQGIKNSKIKSESKTK